MDTGEKIVNEKWQQKISSFSFMALLALLLYFMANSLMGSFGLLLSLFTLILFTSFHNFIPTNLVLRFLGAESISYNQAPGLYRTAHELSLKAELPEMPGLFLIRDGKVNGFTMGKSNDAGIVLHSGLLNLLNQSELEGVLAHEIAHIKNEDVEIMSLARNLTTLISLFSRYGLLIFFLTLPLQILGQAYIPLPLFLAIFFGPIVSQFVWLALSRTREYNADITAVDLAGHPVGLMNALQKIEYSKYGFFDLLFGRRRMPQADYLSTHPDTESRIKKLESVLPPQKRIIIPEIDFIPGGF
ncbi:zinc metalloprotease HtpX [Candidatus Riflebacteria bacterium]